MGTTNGEPEDGADAGKERVDKEAILDTMMASVTILLHVGHFMLSCTIVGGADDDVSTGRPLPTYVGGSLVNTSSSFGEYSGEAWRELANGLSLSLKPSKEMVIGVE